MNDTPDYNPLHDPSVCRINGQVAALQSRLDQCEEFLRMNRTVITFLHTNGLAETERVIGREQAGSVVGMIAAWGFVTLDLADMRDTIEEAQLLADEDRHRANSPENRAGEEWKGGEADQG